MKVGRFISESEEGAPRQKTQPWPRHGSWTRFTVGRTWQRGVVSRKAGSRVGQGAGMRTVEPEQLGF